MKKFAIIKFIVLASIVTSCDNNDPEIINEEELITKLTVTLTPPTGPAIELVYEDPDGADGPTAPTITGGTLAANTTYTGSIVALDESDPNDVEDITEEIEEEDEEHQFFFSFNGLTGATATATDTDGNGNPLGLAFSLTTGAAGSGSFTVILLHEPDKTAPGVINGDPTNAGGEEDVNATFPITVQ